VVESTGATGDKERRQCRGPDGAVRICNLAYGQTGWLGIAGISIDPGGHIFTGYTKLEVIYGHTDSYNSYAGGDTGGGGVGTCNAPPGKGCNKAGTGQGQGQAPGQDSAPPRRRTTVPAAGASRWAAGVRTRSSCASSLTARATLRS
jgi:hypothetical protein